MFPSNWHIALFIGWFALDYNSLHPKWLCIFDICEWPNFYPSICQQFRCPKCLTEQDSLWTFGWCILSMYSHKRSSLFLHMPRSPSKYKVTQKYKERMWNWEITEAEVLEGGRGQGSNSTCPAKDISHRAAKSLSASFENAGHNTALVCQEGGFYCRTLSRLREIVINCGFHRPGLCQVGKTMDFNLLDLKCQIGPKHFLVL